MKTIISNLVMYNIFTLQLTVDEYKSDFAWNVKIFGWPETFEW